MHAFTLILSLFLTVSVMCLALLDSHLTIHLKDKTVTWQCEPNKPSHHLSCFLSGYSITELKLEHHASSLPASVLFPSQQPLLPPSLLPDDLFILRGSPTLSTSLLDSTVLTSSLATNYSLKSSRNLTHSSFSASPGAWHLFSWNLVHLSRFKEKR